MQREDKPVPRVCWFWIARRRCATSRTKCGYAGWTVAAVARAAWTWLRMWLCQLHADGTTLITVTHNPVYGERAGRCIHMLDGRLRDLA
jgi:hypothetical protein